MWPTRPGPAPPWSSTTSARRTSCSPRRCPSPTSSSTPGPRRRWPSWPAPATGWVGARAPRDPDVARDRQALDRRWRTTIADIVREGQAAGEFVPVDAAAFALRLAALIDGLAILVVLKDPEVTRERMFDLCMDTCARELGFSWTPEDRAAITHAIRR